MKKTVRKNLNESDITLNQILKQLRKDAGVGQDELANLLGVKRVTYSAYESGRIQPSADKLYTLANYYGIGVELLMSGLGVAKTKKEERPYKSELEATREYATKADELLYYFKNLTDKQKDMVFELTRFMYLDKR